MQRAEGPDDKARSTTALRIFALLLAIDLGLLSFLFVETMRA